MGWALGIATYLVIWWVVFFAVLPFGVTSQHEAGEFTEGTDPGAPTVPWDPLESTCRHASLSIL